MNSFLNLLTHPPTPSLQSNGRGVTCYMLVGFTLPLLFKGRDRDGLRENREWLKKIWEY